MMHNKLDVYRMSIAIIQIQCPINTSAVEAVVLLHKDCNPHPVLLIHHNRRTRLDCEAVVEVPLRRG